MDELRKQDYADVLRSVPQRILVLKADVPEFTIVEASEEYLNLVTMEHEELVGRSIFEVFPEDETGSATTEQFRLRAALEEVLASGRRHALSVYRYDLADPQVPDRTFERYWSTTLIPILDDVGEVRFVVVRVEESTDLVFRERYRDWDEGDSRPEEGSRRRILLVECEDSLRQYLKGTLEAQWEVKTVESAAQALDSLDEFVPEAILAAMKLPDRDGFWLLEKFKQRFDVPVVLRIEQTDGRLYRQLLEAGADDVIAGPVTAREYLARLQAQLLESDLKRAVRERVREQYHRALMQAPVAIALLEGPQKVYTLSNPAYDELVGNREVLGRPVREVLWEESLQEELDRLDEVYDTGEPFFARERAVTIGEEEVEIYLNFAFLPYRNHEGEIEGVVIVGYEVSGHVEMRQALERENQRKDIFLAMLGHELRNPLAPIANVNEVLRMAGAGVTEEQLGWATDVIGRQVEQLKRHVNDLLDIARINRGRINIERQEVELDRVLTGAIEACEIAMKEKEQRLFVDRPSREVIVDVDGARMVQVVTNLLDNASKYSPKGSSIWLDARTQGEEDQRRLLIEVSDEGEGIDEDLLPHLFQLFMQADESLARSKGGLGLGLPLVKGITELHGGEVRVHSEGPGQGTRIILDLPVVVSEGVEVSSEQAGAEAEQMRVLVVDDIEDIAKTLVFLFQTRGVEVEEAYSGEEALKVAHRFRPTHIVLDIGLPDIDGYEVARRMRQQESTEGAVLVALTGYGLAKDEERAYEAGFDHHLVKPASPEELFAVLEEEGGTPPMAEGDARGR